MLHGEALTIRTGARLLAKGRVTCLIGPSGCGKTCAGFGNAREDVLICTASQPTTRSPWAPAPAKHWQRGPSASRWRGRLGTA